MSKQLMNTAAQVLYLQKHKKPVFAKNNYRAKTKAKPQSSEHWDFSRVWVKVKVHTI